MARHVAATAVILLAAVTLAGCTGHQAGIYWRDRQQDLIDVLHFDITVENLGAAAYVGPLALGANYYTDPADETKDSRTLQIGLGGVRPLGRNGTLIGVLWPFKTSNEDRKILGPRPKRTPSGFSIGASLGFILGFSLEGDLLEALDFITGLFNVDLMQDDEGPPPLPVPPTPPPPPEPPKPKPKALGGF